MGCQRALPRDPTRCPVAVPSRPRSSQAKKSRLMEQLDGPNKRVRHGPDVFLDLAHSLTKKHFCREHFLNTGGWAHGAVQGGDNCHQQLVPSPKKIKNHDFKIWHFETFGKHRHGVPRTRAVPKNGAPMLARKERRHVGGQLKLFKRKQEYSVRPKDDIQDDFLF